MKKNIKLLVCIISILLVMVVSIFLNPFSSKLKFIPKYIFGKKGTELGAFDRIDSLVIRDHYLFVADSGNSRIQVLKIMPDGNLSPLLAFGKEGSGLGEFLSPCILAVRDNYLFVADFGNSRIQVLKIMPDGNLSPLLAFGKEGSGLGEFSIKGESLETAKPLGLAIRDNYLFVADSGNSRIQVLKIMPDGNLSPLLAFGKEGKGLGEFGIPFGLSAKDHYLFVADSGNSRIQVLKIMPDGNLSPLLAFGKEGKGLGEFGKFLTSLAIRHGYLYVADTSNNNIQILKIEY